MSALLDTIDSPADLKRLTRAQLPQLAAEMRQRILEVVAKNGGHLASNLWLTELPLPCIICSTGHRPDYLGRRPSGVPA